MIKQQEGVHAHVCDIGEAYYRELVTAWFVFHQLVETGSAALPVLIAEKSLREFVRAIDRRHAITDERSEQIIADAIRRWNETVDRLRGALNNEGADTTADILTALRSAG